MHNPITLLTDIQREWRFLPRLALVVRTTHPPWVAASARHVSMDLSPNDHAICQAYYSKFIAQLTVLRSRWRVTLALAMLLSMTVAARAMEVGLDAYRMAILAVVLIAILFPALFIHIGMSCEYVAAQALLQALRSREHTGILAPRESEADSVQNNKVS